MPPKGYQPLKGKKVNTVPKHKILFMDSNDLLFANKEMWEASLVFSWNKTTNIFTVKKDRYGGDTDKQYTKDELIELFSSNPDLNMSELKKVLGARKLNSLKKRKPHLFV